MKKSIFLTLKFQLVTGAVLLLTLTLLPIAHLLIERQKSVLIDDLDKTTVLHGRGVATASAKALLRPDPEFELFPLVERTTATSTNVVSLVITDSQGNIQAAKALQDINTKFELELEGYEPRLSTVLEQGEVLYQSPGALLFVTPIIGSGREIGMVYLGYSTHELTSAVREAVSMTVLYSAIALLAGIAGALLMFRRISRPMDIMMEGVQRLGEGELNTRIKVPARNEFHLLAGAFNNMTKQLFSAQQQLVEKQVMDRELTIAHDIQSTLIPHDIPQPDGYTIHSHYQAAMQVGGDYVDVIQIDPNKILLLVADVSGKGIPGLVVMAMLKTLVNSISKTRQRPDNILHELNRALRPNMRKHMFVTMSLGVLDTRTGHLTCASAGHNPLVIFDRASGVCLEHPVKGRPLGLFNDTDFCPRVESYEHRLSPGDALLLYTDGLVESMDSERRQFGSERMLRIVAEHAGDGAKGIVEHLTRAEKRFRGGGSPSDDLTLLAISANQNVVATSLAPGSVTE